MTPYAKARCTNPGAFYDNADEVLGDENLTDPEKEYVLKSMAADAELYTAVDLAREAPDERPRHINEIHSALKQLGESHAFADDDVADPVRSPVEQNDFERIVAAVAGDDDLDREVIRLAEVIARLSGAELILVSVVEPALNPEVYASMSPIGGVVVAERETHREPDTRIREREHRIRELAESEESACSAYHIDVRNGQLHDELLQATKDHSASLVVMGLQHRNWLEGILWPEAAREFANSTTCPVLVVPQPAGQ